MKECSSLEEALQFWASSRAPVEFNKWQPIYAQIRRLLVPTAKPGNFSRESAEAWRRVMTTVHGPGWDSSSRRQEPERLTGAPGADGGGWLGSSSPFPGDP